MTVNIANVPATPLGAGGTTVGSGLVLSGGALSVNVGSGLLISGGKIAAPGWLAAMAAQAVTLAGIPLASLTWSLCDASMGLTDCPNVPGGSGTLTFSTSPRGGVVLVSSTGTAGRWGCAGYLNNGIVGNLKTDRWMVAFHAKLSAGDAASSHEMCLAPGGGFTTVTGTNTGVGFQGVNGVVSLVLNNGGSLTTVATAWPYDTAASHDFLIYNDGTNVGAVIDLVSAGASLASNLPANAGCGHSVVAANGATSAARTILLDKMVTFVDATA